MGGLGAGVSSLKTSRLKIVGLVKGLHASLGFARIIWLYWSIHGSTGSLPLPSIPPLLGWLIGATGGPAVREPAASHNGWIQAYLRLGRGAAPESPATETPVDP